MIPFDGGKVEVNLNFDRDSVRFFAKRILLLVEEWQWERRNAAGQ